MEGKSTLLQIICGTLAATNGKVIKWRVVALLELEGLIRNLRVGRIYINGILLDCEIKLKRELKK